MVIRSPCADCSRRYESKDCAECRDCQKRIDYARCPTKAVGPESPGEPPEIFPTKDPTEKPKICIVEGCEEPAWVKGLCKRHYHKNRDANRTRIRPKKQKTKSLDKGGAMVPIPEDVLNIQSISIPSDLWQRLSEIAGKEYRTPEMQALFFLHFMATSYPKAVYVED